MRRKQLRPFGQSVRPTRVISLLLGVAVLWMLYDRFRDPNTWRFVLGGNDQPPVLVQAAEAKDGKPVAEEVVIPGPNDLDAEEQERAAEQFELVVDKSELRGREMPAYWRLVNWSRTQPMAQLEKRARRDLLMTNLWQQPEKHRGAYPIYLRLHVTRVVTWESDSNSARVGRIYEVWATTDESRGNPYCVILTDPPAGLPIGSDLNAELVFAGYFLKNMAYDTFNGKRRATPLLIGRARLLAMPKVAKAEDDPNFVYVFVGTAGLCLAAIVGFLFLRRRKPIATRRTEEGAEMPETVTLGALSGASGEVAEFDGNAPTSVDFGAIILGASHFDTPAPLVNEEDAWESEATGNETPQAPGEKPHSKVSGGASATS